MEKQKWEQPNIIVQLGATYIHKETNTLMKLQIGSTLENKLMLCPAGKDWIGSAQEFDKQFELVSKFERDKAFLI